MVTTRQGDNESTVTNAAPIVNIDDDVQNIIEKTPPKSEGVDTADLVQAETSPAVPPSGGASPLSKEQKHREYMREYARKKRAEKKAGINAPDPRPLLSKPAIENQSQQPALQKIPVEVSARLINTSYESLLQAVLGGHVELLQYERLALDSALIEYLKLNNYDVPPAWALAFAYGTITVSKFQQPKSRERVAGFMGYIKGKFQRKPKFKPSGE